MKCDVAIVGAGLSGLAAAIHLQREGHDVRLFEKSDAPGGRVRTDRLDGFQLDRGFQVYLTGYPEARRMLDHTRLQLKAFEPGAMVRVGDHFERVADPLRLPRYAWETLTSNVGNLLDKARVGLMQLQATRRSLDDIMHAPEKSTIEELNEWGFSDRMIDRFFRPWLGGIFLERDLATSSRMMNFVFRMMATGKTVLPAAGIQSIPEQLASRLRTGTLSLDCGVAAVAPDRLKLEDGRTIWARAVILATQAPETARLLGRKRLDVGSRSVTCVYFGAHQSPVDGAWLVLNGDGNGAVNNLHVASEVSASYAPLGSSLISATVLGNPVISDRELVSAVRGQLRGWFGTVANRWTHLRTYRIRHAQPLQLTGFRDRAKRAPVRDGVFLAGDHLDTASINGALKSGRRTAAFVNRHLNDGKIP